MLSDEERDAAMYIFEEAQKVSAIYGDLIIEASGERANVAIGTAALMLVGFAKMSGMSIHDCVGIVMATYKATKDFDRPNHETH
jgi:hypothetical protein